MGKALQPLPRLIWFLQNSKFSYLKLGLFLLWLLQEQTSAMFQLWSKSKRGSKVTWQSRHYFTQFLNLNHLITFKRFDVINCKACTGYVHKNQAEQIESCIRIIHWPSRLLFVFLNYIHIFFLTSFRKLLAVSKKDNDKTQCLEKWQWICHLLAQFWRYLLVMCAIHPHFWKCNSESITDIQSKSLSLGNI